VRRFLKPGTMLGVIAVVIAMTGSAVAGTLITSVSIQDGTIKARDIRKGTISESRLSADVRNQLAETGEDGADGPAGPRGPQGVQGDSGPQGPRGVQGFTGPPGQGEQGPAGSPGKSVYEVWLAAPGNAGKTEAEFLASLRGAQGERGPSGQDGAKGDTGPAGPKGDTGAAGPKGDTGATGAVGPKGDTGATGAQGPKGDTGAPGAKGDKGDTGAAGPKGDAGATGATGERGADGASAFDLWLALPGTEGGVNDFLASLVGAQGPQGERGEQGPQGERGPAGPQGERGEQGPQGEQGPVGPQGEIGPAGPQGASGQNGLDSDRPRVIGGQNLRGFTLAPNGDNGDSSPNGTLSFATPPAAPTLGDKALKFTSTTGRPVVLYLPLPSGYDAANGPRPLLAEVTKASYGSLIHTQPQNALDIGFQFEVLKANVGTASGYTTVVFEPYHSGADETKDVWHRHSVDISKVWSTRALPGGVCTQASPCLFREFRELNPYAEVLTAKLKIGQNSGEGWPGFEGYLDDLSFGFGPVVRYDFGG
jgi:Collagen triple helix repeat (20 copies)